MSYDAKKTRTARAKIRQIYKARGRRREALQKSLLYWYETEVRFYRDLPCGLATTINRAAQFRDNSLFSRNRDLCWDMKR